MNVLMALNHLKKTLSFQINNKINKNNKNKNKSAQSSNPNSKGDIFLKSLSPTTRWLPWGWARPK
jgi:hypothetical protein